MPTPFKIPPSCAAVRLNVAAALLAPSSTVDLQLALTHALALPIALYGGARAVSAGPEDASQAVVADGPGLHERDEPRAGLADCYAARRMHGDYFPACPVEGPVEPAPRSGHMGVVVAVPQKCATCGHLFEGGCRRAMATVGRYLHLDHGPCGVPGPTDPVIYDGHYLRAKVTVPRKCCGCPHLAVSTARGFSCAKDARTWGLLGRGLDWGGWRPGRVTLSLSSGRDVTRELADHAFAGDRVAFVRAYRRTYPDVSIDVARTEFDACRTLIDGA